MTAPIADASSRSLATAIRVRMPLVSLAMRPLLELWADVLCPVRPLRTHTTRAIDNCAQLFGGIFCISVNIVSPRRDSPCPESRLTRECVKLENTGADGSPT